MPDQDVALVFPFGRPVEPYRPADRSRRRVFVLGAYPSALHVRWQPPAPWRPITAVAVDNEPSPFWDGHDQAERVAAWKVAVAFQESWGEVQPAGRFNGSSGVWVLTQVLQPLALYPREVWFSDCLNTYRCSQGLARRLEDTYRPASRVLGLPLPQLLPHPTEAQIVAEARAHHPRLRDELLAAQPDVVVTLGNAALRVLGELSGQPSPLPLRLTLDAAAYGQPTALAIAGLPPTRVLALAHPGAPPRYKTLHQNWLATQPRL